MGSNHAASFRTIYTADQIQKRVSDLAADISRTLGGGDLLCLVVLRGGIFFGADLIRQLKGFDRIDIDFVRLASYAGIKSSGDVKIRGHLPPVAGCNVLVIEDLIDTGHTLTVLHQALLGVGAQSVRYAVLVNKPHRRRKEFKADFVAFDLKEDAYLVGYGMDYENNYRALTHIAAVDKK
ncbi:MAG: hypoxanthine phosphoribosyltransferase [Planctomycetaceae bacterium]|nr:hypoxanthine phosphoribosyltransferase [Planctomycetaceae bacterium]